MYVPTPEAMLNHLLRELLTWETLMYVVGTVAVFTVIAIVLELLDTTRSNRK